MRSIARSGRLLRALAQLLPNAELSLIHERPWHSLTFCGVQVCISVTVAPRYHADAMTRFVQNLPEHEFDLCGQLVADIAVVETGGTESPLRFMIDALLLDA